MLEGLNEVFTYKANVRSREYVWERYRRIGKLAFFPVTGCVVFFVGYESVGLVLCSLILLQYFPISDLLFLRTRYGLLKNEWLIEYRILFKTSIDLGNAVLCRYSLEGEQEIHALCVAHKRKRKLNQNGSSPGFAGG